MPGLFRKGSPYSELMELVVKILRMATYSTKALLHQYESSLSNIYNPDLRKTSGVIETLSFEIRSGLDQWRSR